MGALRILKSLSRIAIVFLVCMSFATTGFAQATGPDGENARPISGPRKQLATIIFAGLGGAILGLSTLSFYGRPQDKLSNIAIGFAVGVIAGTSYVTYKAATNPTELYGTIPQIEREGMVGSRLAGVPQAQPLKLGYTFEF